MYNFFLDSKIVFDRVIGHSLKTNGEGAPIHLVLLLTDWCHHPECEIRQGTSKLIPFRTTNAIRD